jgi:hypothetical protein
VGKVKTIQAVTKEKNTEIEKAQSRHSKSRAK